MYSFSFWIVFPCPYNLLLLLSFISSQSGYLGASWRNGFLCTLWSPLGVDGLVLRVLSLYNYFLFLYVYRKRFMVRNWFVQNGGWESQGLQPASRRPGRANGVSCCRSLSPKAGEDWRPRSKTRLAEREQILPWILSLLFYSSLQGIGWDPPTPGRAICFTQSPISNADLTRNTLRHTQNSVQPNIWTLCGPVNLTHKINHHSY